MWLLEEIMWYNPFFHPRVNMNATSSYQINLGKNYGYLANLLLFFVYSHSFLFFFTSICINLNCKLIF